MFGNDPQPTPPAPALPAEVAPPPSYQANSGNARAPGTAKPKPYGGTLLTSPIGSAGDAPVAKKSLLGQ